MFIIFLLIFWFNNGQKGVQFFGEKIGGKTVEGKKVMRVVEDTDDAAFLKTFCATKC